MATSLIRARDPLGDAREEGVRIDTSPDVLHAHHEDGAHFAGGRADGVARPRTERDVARLLASSSRVLPIGAQSSLTGGATPLGGLVLSTVRMTGIQEVGQRLFRVNAGVPIQTLQELLHQQGCWYAASPTFTGACAGGVVATNAAGASTFKYGSTRAWTEGLTVVLACGHVLDVQRGNTVARDGGFTVECPCGCRRVQHGRYQMPEVPKVSAGYFAAPGMDLIDLFIGAEGTLGVITSVTFRALAEPPAVAWALVPVADEAQALSLVSVLRRASRDTWRGDSGGIDVSAIEHVDSRCLEILREDGVDRRLDIDVPPETAVMLLVQLELPAGTTPSDGYAQTAAAFSDSPPDTPLIRFLRALESADVLEATQIAWPGERRRIEQFLAFRESAPAGVNRRVAEAKRTDDRIEKTAADMIVPFEHFGEMLGIYREGYTRRGLDFAIWGHVSDGNVHPNVIPGSYEDVEAGREAILEFGREVARLGGSPLAEHGVGRSSVKQALLRQLYGDQGIEEMRAIKKVLDPEWKLAPGVLFNRPI